MKSTDKFYNDYKNALIDVWKNDNKMIDYCLKKTSRALMVDGLLFTTDKPSIETSFCFGYDCSSVDNESFDNANKMVDHSLTNASYFINENLKSIDQEIKALEDNNLIKYYLIKGAYLSQSPDNPLRHIQYMKRWEYAEDYGEEKKEATDEMIKAYIEALKLDRVDFQKRLNTYLKIYGLSKLRSWSYWRD